MMQPVDMSGAILKIKRADYHIKELKSIFSRRVNAHARAIRAEQRKHPGKRKPKYISPNFPEHLPTIIGDAVHNLRVSLDHAYWVLVERNNGTFKPDVKFPFFDTLKSVEGSVAGLPDRAKPKAEIIRFIIDEMQPYKGGNLNLYELHRLDITDKHKVILPSLTTFSIKDNEPVFFQRPDGREIAIKRWDIRPGDVNLSAPLGTDPVGDLSVSQYKGNIKQSISICFGNGPLEHRPIIETLETISANISWAVNEMVRRF